MNHGEVGYRYWCAYRDAIENFVKVQDANENIHMIRAFANVVRIRERDLDIIEGKVKYNDALIPIRQLGR